MLDLARLSTFDFDHDTQIIPGQLHAHLARISGIKEAWRPVTDGPADGILSLPFRKCKENEPRTEFSQRKDMVFFELANFEHWVKLPAENYLSSPSSGSVLTA